MNNIIYDQELANKVSPREKEIMQHIKEGRRAREIAALMTISIKTVEVHKRNVFKKTGCKSQAHLVAMLLQGGILI